jgi:hypothetical protein
MVVLVPAPVQEPGGAQIRGGGGQVLSLAGERWPLNFKSNDVYLLNFCENVPGLAP